MSAGVRAAIAELAARLGPDGIAEPASRLGSGWTAEPASRLGSGSTAEPGLPVDPRGLFASTPAAVLRPRDTAQVAAAVRICARHRVGVVPVAGGTGLVGGAAAGPDQVVLDVRRLDGIRALSGDDHAIEVGAGCIVADVQAAARRQGRLFPLRLASEGSARIGGTIATNAGGVNVIRYGMMRSMVLGIEAVLPDGRIFDGLRALHKDNTGIDLKQLFIGSEGTLGIVTAAVLRLYPLPTERVTALAALPGLSALAPLLALARASLDDQLTSMELIPHEGLELVLRHVPQTRRPFATRYPYYCLIEVASSRSGAALAESTVALLGRAESAGLLADAVVATGTRQADQLWRLRESLSEAQRLAGGAVKHDVAVPVGEVAAFIEAASAAVRRVDPAAVILPLGHVGDGNVHFNVVPSGGVAATEPAVWHRFGEVVNEVVGRFGGSISAEHGIGLLKRDALRAAKPPVELALMAAVKAALDPLGIMNPGKILADPAAELAAGAGAGAGAAGVDGDLVGAGSAQP